MAKVKGRDVVLELMNTVERLERGFETHSDRLDEMAQVAMNMAARTTAMEARTSHLEQRMNQLTATVNQLVTTVNQMNATVTAMGTEVTSLRTEAAELSADTTRFAELAVGAAKQGRENQLGIGRLARLLGELAEGTDSRFDQLEHRVTALEKKSA